MKLKFTNSYWSLCCPLFDNPKPYSQLTEKEKQTRREYTRSERREMRDRVKAAGFDMRRTFKTKEAGDAYAAEIKQATGVAVKCEETVGLCL